jgi:hypothetical protein
MTTPRLAELGSLGRALAAAIQRRHELDQIAECGDSVPAQITRDSEAQIRAAELALVRAQSGLAERGESVPAQRRRLRLRRRDDRVRGGGMSEQTPYDLAGLRVVAESQSTDPGIRDAARRVLQDAAAAHERAQRVAQRIARLKASRSP